MVSEDKSQRSTTNTGQHQRESQDGKPWCSQRSVPEARKGLVGKAHYEQAHPAKYLRLSVRVYFIAARATITENTDFPEKIGAPSCTERDCDDDTGNKESPIN